MTKYIYIVYGGENYFADFETEAEAMEFAREQAKKMHVRVEKTLMDMDSDWGYPMGIDSEVIWESDKIDGEIPEKPEEANEFTTDFPESDINELSGSDDEAYGDWVDDEKLKTEFPFKEAVEKLEENEDEVECKVCFELGPKAEYKKLEIGYVCPKCAQEMQSHQGTNLDLIDSDPFSLDYEDPRDFEKPEEEAAKEEPVDANEVRKHEKNIEEDLKIITDFNSYKPWSGAVDTYELIRDANKLEDLEFYLEELYPDGITETQLNDILWFDGDQVLSDLGLGDTEDEEDFSESLVEDILTELGPEVGALHVVRNTRIDKVYGADGYNVFTREAGGDWKPFKQCNKIADAIAYARDHSKVAGKDAFGKVVILKNNKEAIIFKNGQPTTSNLDEIDKEIKTKGWDKKLGRDKRSDDLVTVTFDVNGAKTELENKHVAAGKEFKLPECTLEAPEGKEFDGYEINGEKKASGDTIIIDADTTIKLLWKETPVESESSEEATSTEADSTDTSTDTSTDASTDSEAIATASDIEAKIRAKFPTYKDKTINTIISVLRRAGIVEEYSDSLIGDYLTEDLLNERAMADTPFDSEVKIGDKIKINHLEGEDNTYDGATGEVLNIDGIGQLHGTWGGLAVIPGVDDFEIIVEEHVNDRPADIESDQEYQGVDNAIVDCKKYTVVAHSEDEKPIDCKLEKPALEEPVAGEQVNVDLYEAKKDDEEIPADPEYVKLEVHNILNDLVADEIEAINGYEEAKAEILDAPIEHKDEIVSTIDHVEDEEKEHIDELVDATSEIPFGGEHKEEAPVAEEHLNQEFPEVEEDLVEAISDKKLTEVEDYLKDADHGSIDFEWENDYDFCNGSILWNKDKGIFEAGLSIYHASEDNNANNPEAHTDEEDYSADTIKELYDTLAEDFGEEFERAFEDAVSPKELTESEAKPEGNKVLSYNKALAIANSEGKPVIYGYTNTSYNGKYFEVDPIVCNSVSDETKKFKQQYKSAGTVYVAYPGKSFIESLRENADVDYVEYMHSYCNALEPHMDELRKIEDAEKLKKAILDIINEDPDVNTTEKKNKFIWLIKNKKWSSTKNIMAYLDKAMAKAKSIEVKVDDAGELVKEELDPKETQFVFTPEEQEEYNCDEDGNVNDSYDQLCHCGWCGEVYSTSEMRHEVDFGWICSRCEDELKSHGGPLTFIENEELDK